MTKKHRVTLTPEERDQLTSLLRKGKSSARQLAHARLLLAVDESQPAPHPTDTEAARSLHLSTRTVERIRERFVRQGLDAALHAQPSSRRYERALDGAQEARLIALACSAPPEGKARWTLRLLADRAVEVELAETLSYETVRQTLKKTNLSLI